MFRYDDNFVDMMIYREVNIQGILDSFSYDIGPYDYAEQKRCAESAGFNYDDLTDEEIAYIQSILSERG